MEERDSLRKKHWVSLDKRQECLALFQEGNGYKSTATMTGLNKYTVRDYRRRYAQGDFCILCTGNR